MKRGKQHQNKQHHFDKRHEPQHHAFCVRHAVSTGGNFFEFFFPKKMEKEGQTLFFS